MGVLGWGEWGALAVENGLAAVGFSLDGAPSSAVLFLRLT